MEIYKIPLGMIYYNCLASTQTVTTLAIRANTSITVLPKSNAVPGSLGGGIFVTIITEPS